jgi:hypothetical protein
MSGRRAKKIRELARRIEVARAAYGDQEGSESVCPGCSGEDCQGVGLNDATGKWECVRGRVVNRRVDPEAGTGWKPN